MNKYCDNNAEYLLNIKPLAIYNVGIIALVFIFCLCFSLFKYEIYALENAKAIYLSEGCQIQINLSVEDTKKMLVSKQIQVDGSMFEYSVVEISDILVDPVNYLNYQTILINLKNNCGDWNNNQVLDIVIKYNKEKVIKKIWHKMLKE